MNEIRITEKTLDIKKVFQSKSPGMSKWIPGFVYTYLRKKIHQDRINDFLFRNKDKTDLDFIDAVIEEIGLKFDIIGIENIPATGKYTLAANHALGGADGLGIMQMIGSIRQDFTFLTNDILMLLPNLKNLFTPVNKHGSNIDNMRFINAAFAAENLLLIFPAGLVSRKSKGIIRDLLWKASFVSRSVKNQRDIIPMHVEGRNTNFFYNFATWRKRLGIKANLEMFLLADELFKQKNKTITFTIGKPIPWSLFSEEINFRNWAIIIKEYVYELGKNPDLVFDQAYLESKKVFS
jgi:1-acyl-sn-glycerol-3-phosphate acyltransferase